MRSFFSYGQHSQSTPSPTDPQAPDPQPQQQPPTEQVQQRPAQQQQIQQRPIQQQQIQQRQVQQRPISRLPRPLPLPRLSNFSTNAVQNSAWSSVDFLLGAGMVVVQPSTQKIVVVYETEKKFWFLPRGRKDVGESLEQTALREAYEETGYRTEFLPLLNPTHQPVSPNRADSDWFNTEPIFVTLTSWQPKKRRNGVVETHGGEYLTMWYVGQIPEDAVPDEGTGMADEQNFKSHLLTFDEAINNLWDSERLVLSYAWRIFCNTEREKRNMAAEAAAEESSGQQPS